MDAGINDATVHIVALEQLKKDVELTIRGQVKGGGVQKASVVEVKKWLDAALASSTDAPKALKGGSPRSSPSLVGQGAVNGMLEQLKSRIDARIAELKADPSLANTSMKLWERDTIVEVMSARAVVTIKGGSTQSVSREQVMEWLDAADQPVNASEKK